MTERVRIHEDNSIGVSLGDTEYVLLVEQWEPICRQLAVCIDEVKRRFSTNLITGTPGNKRVVWFIVADQRRIGKAYLKRSNAVEMIPLIEAYYPNATVTVEACEVCYGSNGRPSAESKKLLSERYNMEVPS